MTSVKQSYCLVVSIGTIATNEFHLTCNLVGSEEAADEGLDKIVMAHRIDLLKEALHPGKGMQRQVPKAIAGIRFTKNPPGEMSFYINGFGYLLDVIIEPVLENRLESWRQENIPTSRQKTISGLKHACNCPL